MTKIVNGRLVIITSVIFFLLIGHPVSAAEIRISVLGDSLISGYGLAEEYAFPEQLSVSLKKMGYKVKVLGAGISGDTSAGANERVAWALKQKPHAMIIAIGSNDGLRGLDPKGTYQNIKSIIKKLIKAQVKILLCGMRAPPNLGLEYTAKFDQIFPRLAEEFGLVYYPFFLEGVATISHLNQSDGIHPNQDGVREIVERIKESVMEVLRGIL